MNRKIRVLHLIDNLDLGGAQTVLFGMLEHFDRARFDTELAAIHANQRSLFFTRAAESGVRVVALSPRRWLPFYLATLPWLLFRERFDVVHCHLYASNWLGKPLAKLFGAAAVISHDHCYERFRFDWPIVSGLDGWANRFADRILVISESIRQELIRKENIPPAKIETLLNGLSHRSVPERPQSVRKVVGAAGRLVGWKRFDRFLRTGKNLIELDPEYRLRLAGSGPEERALRMLARELGIYEKVTWCGAVSRMDEFFQSIDLFLLSSEFEDVPMVLLEAMYHRVPSAVATVNPSREELAGDVLPLNPEETEESWANRIHELFGHDREYSDLGERGRSLVERKFMAENSVRRLETLYDKLAGGR